MKSNRLLIWIILSLLLLYAYQADAGSQPPSSRQIQTDITAAPYNLDNTGQTDCAPGIALLQKHLGPQGTICIPQGTFVIKTNLTIPAGMVLRVENGGLLKVSPGAVLTINGPLEAGLRQIFVASDTENVRLGFGSVTHACPQWWGAVGDGVVATGTGTDNTLAINAACAAYPVVYLTRGVYKISGGIQLTGDQVFYGDGMGQTVLFASRASNHDSFNMMTSKNYLDGASNPQRIHLKGFTLECRCHLLTEVGKSQNNAGNAIALQYAEGSVVEEVGFKDTALNGICIFDTAEATVRRCVGQNLGHLSFANKTDANWEVKASANGITFSGSRPTQGTHAIIEDCLIETFRDVGINFWNLHNGRAVNCDVKGGRLPGVTSLNGGVVGFSSEALAERVTFDSCRYLNCLGHGFLLSGTGTTAENCTVVKDNQATNDYAAFSIQGNDTSLLNCRVEVPGGNHFLYGVGIWIDKPGGKVAGTLIRGCRINGSQFGIWARNPENTELAGNYIYGGFAQQTGGICLTATPEAGKYATHNQVRDNTLVKSNYFGIEVANQSEVLVEGNTILGAATAAIHVEGADAVTIRGNRCRKYESNDKIGYGVLFAHNPSHCRIIDNDFSDYNNSSGLLPYGLYLPTTRTPALVIHSNTGVPEEQVDGKLTALAGSYMRTRTAAGKDIQLMVNTDGGTSWKRNRP
jgi:hypothetical protein